jgi:hypothetical protein
MYGYSLYGLTVTSNVAIAGLTTTAAPSPDLHIHLEAEAEPFPPLPQAAPYYQSPAHQDNGQPSLIVWANLLGSEFWFRYGDGTTFWLTLSPPQIRATWSAPLTLDDTVTYLVGPVLAFFLRWQGILCLHGSVVQMGEGAIAFVGSAGAGKSTTAALLSQAGYPVLSDDVAVIHQPQTPHVAPGYPRLRLWRSSVELLYGRPDALPRIVPTHPTWDKQYLDLTQSSQQFQRDPIPLQRIYILGPRSHRHSTLTPITPAAALLALTPHSSVSYLLTKTMRRQEFLALSQVIRQTSCAILSVASNLRDAEQLMTLIAAPSPQ